MKDLFIIESGLKRKAEYHHCEICNKKFLRRIYKNSNKSKKYCSKECLLESKTNNVELQCYCCGKKFKRCKSKLRDTKHGVYFCSRRCKDKSQSLNGNCPKIRPSHYGSEEEYYKQYLKRHPDAICVGCGEDRKFLLRVHHIDGDRSNNKENNLELVCGNCHTIRHLKKSNNRWYFSTSALTSREEINNFYK